MNYQLAPHIADQIEATPADQIEAARPRLRPVRQRPRPPQRPPRSSTTSTPHQPRRGMTPTSTTTNPSTTNL